MDQKEHLRMRRERKTLVAMIAIYCRDAHGSRGELCAERQEPKAYAMQRLTRRPFQEEKTTCAQCPVHCYQPDMRDKVRAVMRYSGPRMLFRHPILTIYHVLDGRRQGPIRPKRKKQFQVKYLRQTITTQAITGFCFKFVIKFPSSPDLRRKSLYQASPSQIIFRRINYGYLKNPGEIPSST